jgi:hypothetical protein
MQPRVVIVGIDRGVQRKFRTRKNFAQLVGIPYDDGFYRRFAWRNLYGEETALDRTAEENERRARSLLPELRRFDRVVLLGGEVAKAFGVSHLPKYKWFELQGAGTLAARFIHTSQFLWNMTQHQAELRGEATRFAQWLLEFAERDDGAT